MFVCVCHAVPESAVLEAFAAGHTADDVVQMTKASTSCGCCASALAQLVPPRKRCERTGGFCTGCRDAHPDHPSDTGPASGSRSRFAIFHP